MLQKKYSLVLFRTIWPAQLMPAYWCLVYDSALKMDDLGRTLRCNTRVSVSACVPHRVFPQGDPNSPSAGAPSCSLKVSAAQLVRIVLHCISTTLTWHTAFLPSLLVFFSFFLSLSLFFYYISQLGSLSLSLEILSLLCELTWIALPPGLPQAPFIMMLQFNVKFILLFAVASPHSLCLDSTFGSFFLMAPVDSAALATFLSHSCILDWQAFALSLHLSFGLEMFNLWIRSLGFGIHRWAAQCENVC